MAKSSTAPPPKQPKNEPNRPVAEFKYGGCRASVWANPGKNGGVRYSVTMSRSYKDEETAAWKDTQSLHRDDIPLMKICLEDPNRWIASPRNRTPGQEG